jgi:hypothetical protein
LVKICAFCCHVIQIVFSRSIRSLPSPRVFSLSVHPGNLLKALQDLRYIFFDLCIPCRPRCCPRRLVRLVDESAKTRAPIKLLSNRTLKRNSNVPFLASLSLYRELRTCPSSVRQ